MFIAVRRPLDETIDAQNLKRSETELTCRCPRPSRCRRTRPPRRPPPAAASGQAQAGGQASQARTRSDVSAAAVAVDAAAQRLRRTRLATA